MNDAEAPKTFAGVLLLVVPLPKAGGAGAEAPKIDVVFVDGVPNEFDWVWLPNAGGAFEKLPKLGSPPDDCAVVVAAPKTGAAGDPPKAGGLLAEAPPNVNGVESGLVGFAVVLPNENDDDAAELPNTGVAEFDVVLPPNVLDPKAGGLFSVAGAAAG